MFFFIEVFWMILFYVVTHRHRLFPSMFAFFLRVLGSHSGFLVSIWTISQHWGWAVFKCPYCVRNHQTNNSIASDGHMALPEKSLAKIASCVPRKTRQTAYRSTQRSLMWSLKKYDCWWTAHLNSYKITEKNEFWWLNSGLHPKYKLKFLEKS